MLAILLIVSSVSALSPSSYVHDPLFVKQINMQAKTWKSGESSVFAKRTLAEIKPLLGWKGKDVSLTSTKTPVGFKSANIPASFDARVQWENCTSVSTIFDQARCGSCWAFGAVQTIQDRFCIASNGNNQVLLSFEDMVSCDDSDDGCEGGSAEGAMSYAQSSGLVSAGCYPYGVPTCDPSQEPCLNFVDTPSCQQTCQDNEQWTQSKHYLSTWNSIAGDADSIATEIMNNGPVEACFSVYEDLLSYKSGVYQHTTGDYLGGHCLKLAGWGVENGTPYWLAMNSWTTYWGDQGTFKILRGSDECGIEDDVVAGVVSTRRA